MMWVYKMWECERNGLTDEANRIRRALMDWPVETDRRDRAPYRPEYMQKLLDSMNGVPNEP